MVDPVIELSSLKEEVNNKKNDIASENNLKKEDLVDEDIVKKVINDANNYFLVSILSPEITKNEEKKREHKDKLIEILPHFLKSQFILLALLVSCIIISIFAFHGLENDLELSYIETIINFISIYIASIVVELIAILKYIVNNVFDTSIAWLVELYKKDDARKSNIDKV